MRRSSRATSRSSATSGATSSSPHRSCSSCGGPTRPSRPPTGACSSSSDAGHLERFRPIAAPRLLSLDLPPRRTKATASSSTPALIPTAQRYTRRTIYDYGHVLHEIQLNAWVLAYRRALGDALLAWDGETDIDPPPRPRQEQMRLDDDWSAEGLPTTRAATRPPRRHPRDRRRHDDASSRLILIEYDRTRRIDKNYDKFRRYDAFLMLVVAPHAARATATTPPFVLFVCQDDEQRELFLDAAAVSWCRCLRVGPRRPTGRRPASGPDFAPRLGFRGRGVHRFALDPPSSTCQINRAGQRRRETGGPEAGRRQAGSGRA